MLQELLTLEEKGWKALATDQKTARAFYAEVLHDDALMLFPGGMRLEGKDAILAALAAQPWQRYDLSETQVIDLGDAGVLVYRVTAVRAGAQPYTALVSSTYAREDDGWRLIVHQQTA